MADTDPQVDSITARFRDSKRMERLFQEAVTEALTKQEAKKAGAPASGEVPPSGGARKPGAAASPAAQ